MGQHAAIYTRVSTSDQSCERQLVELTAFAERGGYDVVGVFKDTASGASANRIARNLVLDLAQARHIDAILVSELSRWGRSTQDLLDTLNRLAGWKASVVAMSGMTFEVETPHGRMMATMLAGIAQFERDLLSERVKFGLAAARARGKKLGRQTGQRPKSDKLAPKVQISLCIDRIVTRNCSVTRRLPGLGILARRNRLMAFASVICPVCGDTADVLIGWDLVQKFW
tara:strand:- start:314 stop:994 length:681 start_codon:yes stop_codon:yes gene_type:complete